MKINLVLVILFTSSQIIYSQNIKLVDQNQKVLINHNVKISQGNIFHERFSDSIGKINLDDKLLDLSRPIDINPVGFISQKFTHKNDTTLTFRTNEFELNEVFISIQKKKKVIFENFKQKENRLSWFLPNQHNFTGSLEPNYEYLTLIDQFEFEVYKTEFKQISFETINKIPHLDIPIIYRLNIYNEDKELIYSQDKKVQSSEIEVNLIFEISQFLSLSSNLFYVGLSIPRDEPLKGYRKECPDYFISFEHRRFKKAKGYKRFLFDFDNSDWQIISADNDELDELTKQLFLSQPENPLKNYNLKITITSEQSK